MLFTAVLVASVGMLAYRAGYIAHADQTLANLAADCMASKVQPEECLRMAERSDAQRPAWLR